VRGEEKSREEERQTMPQKYDHTQLLAVESWRCCVRDYTMRGKILQNKKEDGQRNVAKPGWSFGDNFRKKLTEVVTVCGRERAVCVLWKWLAFLPSSITSGTDCRERLPSR
jgi:hypothetical protein